MSPDIRITRLGRIAAAVATPLPSGQRGVYQLGEAVQLDADTVGLFLNIRCCGADAYDIEIGSDLAIVSGLDWRHPRAVMPLSRAAVEAHPETGEPCFVCTYPMHSGFVPAGTLRPDGTPHPYAGRGFGLAHQVGLPSDEHGTLRGSGVLTESFHRLELRDFEYRDGSLREIRQIRLDVDELVPEWRFVSMPLGMLWPDGDDLVGGMVMRRREAGSLPRAGFLRWRCREAGWRPVEFVPVGPVGSYEPSLVRDTDGAWLFTARGCHEYRLPDEPEAVAEAAQMNDLRVWGSDDGGRHWRLRLHQRGFRSCVTTNIGITVGGTPYLLGTPYTDADSLGRTISGGVMHSDWMRERIVAWPLTPERDRVLEPVMLHDAPAEFGPPPGGGIWQVDHPVSHLLYGKGAWHNVIFHRALSELEAHGKAEPTGFTGCYADECGAAGNPAMPLWKFA